MRSGSYRRWAEQDPGLCLVPLHCFFSVTDAGAEESRPLVQITVEDRSRQAVEISNQLTRSHREHFGRGAGNVKTVIQKGFVITFLEDIYTPWEKTMISGGYEQLVMDGRFAFQQMMRDCYIGIVETVTDRKVRAFLSQNHIDPAVAVEMFVLEAEGGDGASDVGGKEDA